MSNENQEYNAGDPEQVAEAKRKAKLRETRISGQTKVVMATAEGRAWMWELLGKCGLFRTSFALDSHVTSFNCGKQDIGHQILAGIMKECPELYSLMQKEQENA